MSERPAKYLSIRELRPKLPSVLRDVATNYARYVVTRRGKPQAVVLGLEDYERLRAAARKADRQRLHALLKEECLAMREEANILAREFEPLDREAMKYVD